MNRTISCLTPDQLALAVIFGVTPADAGPRNPPFDWPQVRHDLYQRPRSWRDALDCDVQQMRWADWTRELEPEDDIFNNIPDGLEGAYCEALDFYRWDYLRLVHQHDAPKPGTPLLRRLWRQNRAECSRVTEHANALRNGWKRWRGTPWHVVRAARRNAFHCHHIDHFRRLAGKPVTYQAPCAPRDLDDGVTFIPASRRAPKRKGRRQ